MPRITPESRHLTLVGLVAILALVGLAATTSAAHDAGGLHVEASTDNVDTDGCTDRCEDQDGDEIYGSIQTGVDNATENGTVTVAPGTYHENVDVTTAGLELVASEDGDVVLDGQESMTVGIWLRADRTAVEGFQIQDYGVGILADADPTGTYEDWRDLMGGRTDDDRLLQGVRIQNNTITAPNLDPPAKNIFGVEEEVLGVWVVKPVNASVTGNQIETAEHGNRATGFQVSRGGDPTVPRDSRVTANVVTVHHDPAPEYSYAWGMAIGEHDYIIQPEEKSNNCLSRPIKYTLSPSCNPAHVTNHLTEEAHREHEQVCDRALAPSSSIQSGIGGVGDRPDAGPGASCPSFPMESPENTSHIPWTNNTIANNTIKAVSDVTDDPEPAKSYGIGVYAVNGDRIANNTVTGTTSLGMYPSGVNLEVIGNLVQNRSPLNPEDPESYLDFSEGLHLGGWNNTLRDNAIRDFQGGFSLGSPKGQYDTHHIDRSNTIDGKPVVYLANENDRVIDATDNPGTVIAVESSNITVQDVTISYAHEGIYFYDTDHSTIENITVSEAARGVYLWQSSDNRITNSTFTQAKPAGHAISLWKRSDRNVLQGNTISGMGSGVYLASSSDNRVVENHITDVQDHGIYAGLADGTIALDNRVTDSRDGFHTFLSDNMLLVGNTMEDNRLGITLHGSVAGSVMRDNRMSNNTYNLHARGPHSIDTSNTVDGKPVYYLVGATGAVIDGNLPDMNPGYVGLVGSANATVRNLNLSNNGGLLVQASPGTHVGNVTVSNAMRGIEVFDSPGTSVEGMAITDVWTGVRLHTSDRASLHHTTVDTRATTGQGVIVSRSDRVTVAETTIDHSNIGVLFFRSEDPRALANEVTLHPHEDGFGDGIVAFLTEGAEFADNRVTNGRWGLLSVVASETTIRSNTVTGTSIGLMSWGTVGDRILDNSARDNGFGAVAAEYTGAGGTPGLTIAGNELINNGNGTLLGATAPPTEGEEPSEYCVTFFFEIKECVTVGGATDGEPRPIAVENNEIRDNTNSGIVFGLSAQSDQIHIRNNTLADNAAFGIDARNISGIVDARENYWGTSDGPSSPDASSPLEDPFTGALANGGGDTVSENASNPGVSNVRFDPWLSHGPNPPNTDEGPLAGLLPGPLAGAAEGEGPEVARP